MKKLLQILLLFSLAVGLRAQSAIADLVVGRTMQVGSLAAGTITPAQISSTQNDYAPSGYATCISMRISSDTTRSITGLVPATTTARWVRILENVGSFTITLVDNSGSSSAGNKFSLAGGNYSITAGATVMLKYDTTTTSWRIIGTQAVSSGGTAAWGSITGSIGDQSDLTSALAAKQALSTPLTTLSGGSDYVQFTGPISSIKVFTLPNSSQSLLYTGGPLGTPSSGLGTNLTGTAAGLTAGTVTTNANLTGDVTSSGNAATVANVPVTATYATDLTAVPLNNGGWNVYQVAGSDATTTGQSLVTVTGLTTDTLSNSTLYEIESVLFVTTSSGTNGTEYGITAGGSGSASVPNVLVTGTTTTNAGSTVTISTIDTATAAFLTTASINGVIYMRGYVTTRSTGAATISIQHLKATSGTSTVKVGSALRIRKL